MPSETSSPAQDVLTQSEAEKRAARVANVSYQLAFDLSAGAETYRGDATARFDVVGDGDLVLELRGRQIERLEINGSAVEPRWARHRLTLPGELLRERNEVRVVYENAYDRAGDGLHHYVDPEDGEEYLYSNLEPYDAHRLFPCFDQPDIKADYHLTVTAPAGWEVIGNAREAGAEPVEGGRMRHIFRPTARFSTYLFALVAGPFHVVRREHRGLPLALYCRRALARHLDPDEFIEITTAGLDFYADLFDRPYPFDKYDQVMCPEFNIGAMENVAAVTFYEKAIFRDPPTESQRRIRAEIILHELAHMWFGNLVTLRWWNDLWLNESFASYVAYLAMDRATRFAGVWQAFNTEMKRWAYRQDQLVTTHPIAGPVPDTDATFLNFDGITYGKGAAVIKQLVATIGPDGFREGMRLYFRRHAWGNATLADFLAALEDGSAQRLTEWSRLWLETPSLNTLAADWSGNGAGIERLSVRQSAPQDHPTLRPHALEIGLATASGDGLAVESLSARIDGPQTELPDARGRPRPVFIYPNHNDHAYAKVTLDAISLSYVREHLGEVADPLLRQLLWLSIWEMVRDRQLPSTDFLALARSELRGEPSLEILEAVLGAVTTALASYVPEARREDEARRFFAAGLEALRSGPAGDIAIDWLRALIGIAATAEDVTTLTRMADGDLATPGASIDQEMRWAIAVKAVAFDVEGADARLAGERRRDPSDRADRAERRAEAARPESDTKSAVWQRLVDNRYPSAQLAIEAMQGFGWPHQRALLEPYVDRYFAALTQVCESTEQRYSVAFVRNLFPAYLPGTAVLERSVRLLDDLAERLPSLARLLREANDDLARAIACRAYAETAAALPVTSG